MVCFSLSCLMRSRDRDKEKKCLPGRDTPD